jgi:glycosyltransferase involved in cell wall biosynthesis
MSVIESLACGVPVIVTRTCPWSEIETDGCGFWVEQTAPAIAAAMSTLAGDPSLRDRMGERGEAFAHDRYSWDAIAPRMARLYADLT